MRDFLFKDLNSKETLYEVVGERFIAREDFLREIELKKDDDLFIEVDGNSSINNIVKFFSAIKHESIPIMKPFYNGKISQENLEERLKNFNNLKIKNLSEKEIENIAFLQSSSGTSGNQKAFAISFSSIINQCISYAKTIGLNKDSVIVSWLPLNHDMGLITSLFLPLLCGCKSVIIPTEKWVVNYPTILDLIQKKRATHVWFPNFCFELLMRYKNFKKNDFSSVKFINCSEPTYDSSVLEFENFFNTKVYSCYALAENTFAVSQASNQSVLKGFRSCGKSIKGTKIKLGKNNEILIKSDCLFSFLVEDGKFKKPSLDKDGWYHTGDIGLFNSDKDLFVVGRLKDIAIVMGKNIVLTDLDFELNKTDSVHKGRLCSFPLVENGTEKVVVLYEAEKNCDLELKTTSYKKYGITIDCYRMLSGSIEKTTSGKNTRDKNKNLFLKRKRVFDLIQSFLLKKSIIYKIDEDFSLRESGVLDSFNTFELISELMINSDIDLDWTEDFRVLDKVGNFIDKFI